MQAQSASQSDWTVLKEWSSEAQTTAMETERFTTTSRTFRLSWSASDITPKSGGVVTVYILTDKGEQAGLGANLQGEGSFEVNSEPGPHYLQINTAGVKWRVAVEQRAAASKRDN